MAKEHDILIPKIMPFLYYITILEKLFRFMVILIKFGPLNKIKDNKNCLIYI